MKYKTRASKIATAGILVAFGIILPLVTAHGFLVAGTVFLPMHLPVLVCGLLCGPLYGLSVGAILPLINCMLTSMPSVYPMLPIMTAELSVYGLIGGLLLHKTPLKDKKYGVYVALVLAMVAGRIAYGIVFSALLLFNPSLKALSVWGAIVTGIPGIIIQLVFIPLIIYVVGGFIKSKKDRAIQLARETIKNDGITCVIIKGGKIIKKSNERGVKPVISYLENGELKDAIVVDKIIGKAVAMILSLAEVEYIYAITISKSAKEFLKNQKIAFDYENETEMIINRKGDGRCPMEETVLDIDDAKLGYEKILEKVKELAK